MGAVVSGTALMRKKAFPDTPPPPRPSGSLVVQQRETAVLPAAESALVSADVEQISLAEALRPKARGCAVPVEENPGWEITVFLRGAISRSGR